MNLIFITTGCLSQRAVEQKQQQVLSTIVLMLDVITSFNFAASLVDGCCVNVKLSSLASQLSSSLLTRILYSLLYCAFCCLSPATVRVLYIVTRPHNCSCAYFVSLFYTRLFSSFHKLRVMPLRSFNLNPQRPYCPVAIATDDAHSYAQHLSPQISRCDVTPYLALWRHATSRAVTSPFPGYTPHVTAKPKTLSRQKVKTELKVVDLFSKSNGIASHSHANG
jgi:hypothetical protein